MQRLHITDLTEEKRYKQIMQMHVYDSHQETWWDAVDRTWYIWEIYLSIYLPICLSVCPETPRSSGNRWYFRDVKVVRWSNFFFQQKFPKIIGLIFHQNGREGSAGFRPPPAPKWDLSGGKMAILFFFFVMVTAQATRSTARAAGVGDRGCVGSSMWRVIGHGYITPTVYFPSLLAWGVS